MERASMLTSSDINVDNPLMLTYLPSEISSSDSRSSYKDTSGGPPKTPVYVQAW